MKMFTKLAVVIFALVSIGHLARFMMNWQVIIEGHVIPRWISLCGFIVPGLLSIMLWRESRR